jgi:putative transcriptional regulator
MTQMWSLCGEREKEPFHYDGCGLDDIYLLSGYEVESTPHGESLRIKNLDGLLRAIGRSLVERKKLLSGKELRFLRVQMDLTQSVLGRFIGLTSQQVARWEKEKGTISGPADRLLRTIFKEHLDGTVQVRELLDVIDELDARINDKQVFTVNEEDWSRAA